MKKVTFFILVLLWTLPVIGQKRALFRDKGSFGFLDGKGQVVIQPEFSGAKRFSGPYARAKKDKKWGYIDVNGQWAISPIYDRVHDFHSGLALVEKDKEWHYINISGDVLSVPEAEKYYDFSDVGVAIIRVDGQIGLLGIDGKFVVTPQYEVIHKFSHGHARFRKDDKWGLLDKNGKVVIPAEYDDLGDYSTQGVWVKKDDKYGVIYKQQYYAVSDVDRVWDFTDHSPLTYAERAGKIGYINHKGQWVIEPQFDKGRAFNQGLAPVSNDGEWGYVNTKGQVVVPFQYRDAEVFSDNGLAPVKVDKNWGFINKTGELVIPDEYQISFGSIFGVGISGFEKGFIGSYARVKKKKLKGFIDTDGKVLGEWHKYRYLGPFVKVSK